MYAYESTSLLDDFLQLTMLSALKWDRCTWLVEVGLRHEDHALDAEQDLHEGRLPGLPPRAGPRAQYTKAHLPIRIPGK